MSNRTKNEICLGLWLFYKMNKQDGLDVEPLKEGFRHELLLGYRTENKNALEGAAENRIAIQGMESMILANKRSLMTKYRLSFRDERTPDQLLRSMVGSMILDMGISEDNKTVWAKKTDGEEEFVIVADNPISEFRVGMTVWIAEPFVMQEDGTGKAWCELTKAEREEASTKGLVRSAGAMPKYLQKRRARITSITVNGDDVNAWLQLMLAEVAPFKREDFEEDEVLTELGITKQEAKEEADPEQEEQQAAPGQEVPQDSERGIDAEKISDEHFEALDDAERPEEPQVAESADAEEEHF